MRSLSDRSSAVLIHLVLLALAAACIFPILVVVSISFSEEVSIFEQGYRLIPAKLDAASYGFIFRSGGQLVSAYWVSLRVILIGIVLSLTVSSLLAYPLSRPDFRYRSWISFFVLFTMLFNGGLVPWYILIVNYLRLKNTLLVLVLPYVVLGWYVMLLRTYFKAVPLELIESAAIDGAGELRTFAEIVIPLVKPGLATVGFLTLLRYWNDWWLPLLFIEKDDLVTVQYLLHRMLGNLEELRRALAEGYADTSGAGEIPSESLRMAMCVVAAGPMLFVFPFFQRYFVRGLTMGAVKG